MIFRSGYFRRSIADLVVWIAEGDERAFAEILNRHQDAVYGFARRLLKDDPEAEDVAQEVFLRLYRASDRYRPQALLRTFLLRITNNICIDYLRKKRPARMDPFPDIPTSEPPWDCWKMPSALPAWKRRPLPSCLCAVSTALPLPAHITNMHRRRCLVDGPKSGAFGWNYFLAPA